MCWPHSHLNRFVIHGKEYGVHDISRVSFSDDPTRAQKLCRGHGLADCAMLHTLLIRITSGFLDDSVPCLRVQSHYGYPSTAGRRSWVLACRRFSRWHSRLIIVKPVAVVSWHRKGSKARWSSRRTVGLLRESVLHRYAQYCNVVRERLLIDH